MTRRHFKFIPAIAAGFMAIALTACGGSSSSSGDSGGATDTPLTPTAPTITTQPAAQSVTAGQTASFTVEASGTAPLTYQWQKNSTDISGATSATYTTPATAIGDNGAQYSVVVFNGAGTVTSDKATLTVTAASGGPGAPTIGTQPANQSVVAGKTATFTVTASGSDGGGPLTYQWQKNGTDISGATLSTYTTPVTVIGDSGTAFTVVVVNNAAKVTSNKATLTVTLAAVAPAITTQPTAQTVTEGQTATFSVTATGTAPLTYQWKKDGTAISGATSSTYTTPATSSADNAAVFTVVVTNGTGSVTSSNAALTVTAAAPVAPAISTQPTAQSIAAGASATFSVAATGTGTLSYQWKKNGTVIPGATTSSYTTPAMGYAGNGAVYSVVVTDSVGTTTSNTATLTVIKSSTAQSYGYVANASDGLFTKEECVQDNNTGLVWEGKTASPATSRLGTSTYTNYDSTSSLQNPFSVVPPTQTEIDASTNSIGYKNSVNASALCGFTDWRLPTKDELNGIVDASQPSPPSINPTWFPNTRIGAYLTSTPHTYASQSWGVFFNNGTAGSVDRANLANNALRLVRCSNGAATCP